MFCWLQQYTKKGALTVFYFVANNTSSTSSSIIMLSNPSNANVSVYPRFIYWPESFINEIEKSFIEFILTGMQKSFFFTNFITVEFVSIVIFE